MMPSSVLKAISEWTGRVIAWLTLPMVIVTFVVVVLRYVFDLGWIWMQESVVWMHAAVFMLAAAYTLRHDEHVRVDIFYRSMSPTRKAWVDLGGTVLFLVPVSVFLIITSWDYVAVSWSIREGSREAGGLPFPFVPLWKTLMPVTAGLLIVQGVADALDALAKLGRGGADAGGGNGGSGGHGGTLVTSAGNVQAADDAERAAPARRLRER